LRNIHTNMSTRKITLCDSKSFDTIRIKKFSKYTLRLSSMSTCFQIAEHVVLM